MTLTLPARAMAARRARYSTASSPNTSMPFRHTQRRHDESRAVQRRLRSRRDQQDRRPTRARRCRRGGRRPIRRRVRPIFRRWAFGCCGDDFLRKRSDRYAHRVRHRRACSRAERSARRKRSGSRCRIPGRTDYAEIVGVVTHVKTYGLDIESSGQIYLSNEQVPWRYSSVVLRTTG